MGEAGPTIGKQERLAFSLLRRGDVLAAAAVCERTPALERSLKLNVLAAETRCCLGHGDLDELERLRDEIFGAGGDDTLRLRVDAAIADHHQSRLDPVCEAIAARALAPIAGEPMLDAEQLWARGRLFRTRAMAATFGGEDEPTVAIALLARATADFGRAGFDAEAARSLAEVHVACCLAFSRGYEQAHDIVSESLARLRKLGATYVDLVLAYRILLDLAVADLAAMHVGADEIDLIGQTRPLHPFARVFVGYVRLLSRLIGEGPTSAVLQAVEDHLALVRTEAMCLTSSQLVVFASVLVDWGHGRPEQLALARRWASQAIAGWTGTRRFNEDLAALLTRLDLLERGDDSAVAAVEAEIERGRRPGQERVVAQRALEAAVAARRLGRHDVAERLRLEAIADLPPPGRRLLWEDVVVARLATNHVRARSKPELRLLGPAVTMANGTEHRTVSPTLARLVIALVAQGGAAPADRLVDTLWPDTDLGTGRARLRVALHRLRRALGDDVDTLQRCGEIVALAPGVDLDTVRFEKLAVGSADDRRLAIELYEGDVAWVQLAYDDVAAALRRRLTAIWRELSRAALADPTLPSATIAHIAEVAGREAGLDPQLAELCTAAQCRLHGGAERSRAAGAG